LRTCLRKLERGALALGNAIDAANGKVEWTYPIPNSEYRGGLTVSGGVVYASTLDGTLWMIDEATGHLILSKSIGGSLLIQPAIGEDANGQMTLVLTDMGSTRWGPPFPGFIQALALPAAPQGGISTATLLLATQIVAVVALASTAILVYSRIRSGRRR